MSKMVCVLRANLICSTATRKKTILRMRKKNPAREIPMRLHPARHWRVNSLGQLPESLQNLNKLKYNNHDMKRPLPTEQANRELHHQNIILILEEVPLLLRRHSKQDGTNLPRTTTSPNPANPSTTHLHLLQDLERCRPTMAIQSHLQHQALVQPSRIRITINPLHARAVNTPTLDLIFPKHQLISTNKVEEEIHGTSLERRDRREVEVMSFECF
jgi:hypothetical protein